MSPSRAVYLQDSCTNTEFVSGKNFIPDFSKFVDTNSLLESYGGFDTNKRTRETFEAEFLDNSEQEILQGRVEADILNCSTGIELYNQTDEEIYETVTRNILIYGEELYPGTELSESNRIYMESRKNRAISTESMVKNNNNKIPNHEIGDKIKIKIPKEDQNRLGDKYLHGVIIGKSNENYEISTEFGTIDRKIHKKHLYRLDSTESLKCSSEKISITAAFRKVSGWTARIEIRCFCKTGCKENRCKCKKNRKKCTMFCHSDYDHICENTSNGCFNNVIESIPNEEHTLD
ncbi:hypothetical protein AYI69_g9954 [Smittium culicis]|uniref:Uncharacterized protein n=1 Tax=Smittium culicis TaxID=133412 RepID=A0A1R1X954_9FUNG|nr:hypothetical protein AYI69_g9954 [Smittium culicis]